MKQVADWRTLLSGAKISATANTMTLTSGLSLAAYAQGTMFAFEVGAANTTAVTLNVDGLGAKAVVKNYNVALRRTVFYAHQDHTNILFLQEISPILYLI